MHVAYMSYMSYLSHILINHYSYSNFMNRLKSLDFFFRNLELFC